MSDNGCSEIAAIAMREMCAAHHGRSSAGDTRGSVCLYKALFSVVAPTGANGNRTRARNSRLCESSFDLHHGLDVDTVPAELLDDLFKL